MARMPTARVPFLITLVALAASVSGHAQVPRSPETARALAVIYADGRTTYRVLRSLGGGSWTPYFPVVAGADTAREGLPLAALQIDHALDGNEVVAAVSLLYGRPHRDRVPVATVRVGADGPVRVDALAAFGVEPVTLSIVAVAPSLAYPLSVVCASGQLDVKVDPVSPDLPAYRVTVVNLSSHALLAFRFEAYRGEEIVLSGRPTGDRNKPLVPPLGEHVFDLPASAGAIPRRDDAAGWPALDRVMVTSVLWDDGTVEGDPELLTSERALSAGRALQIARILDLLREAADPARRPTPAALRRAIDALPSAVEPAAVDAVRASLPDPAAASGARVRQSIELGLIHARNTALADLDAFERVAPDGDPAEFRRWVAEATAEYEAWLTRVQR